MRWKAIIAAAMLTWVIAGAPAQAEDSLYYDLGERAGIVGIIDDAAALWVVDTRIKDQFDNINMVWLKGRLVDQFCQITGGPCQYKGRDMQAAHKGLHLTTREFNALAEDLQTAMEQRSLPYHTQNRMLALLAPMQRQVVSQ